MIDHEFISNNLQPINIGLKPNWELRYQGYFDREEQILIRRLLIATIIFIFFLVIK